MPSDIAVQVEGLGKDYYLGDRARGYRTLRETLTDAAKSAIRRSGRTEGSHDVLQALDDLTFSVPVGETVGFIGHNGAGKSTLLRVLSRITEPTRGWAEIRGRVGALLEVGTGFHPELTGRENIFLNGVILGMSRSDVQRRFDQIVSFAELERFLDTPVKRYSSGMSVRLAFSVAAHLEPEVLIVDEVLAVGDAAFQRRCLERIAQVAREGRTVLFVSHNMAVIQGLCDRGIVLERGRVIADGAIDDAVAAYLATLEDAFTERLADRQDRQGRGEVRATSVTVRGADQGPVSGGPLRIEISVDQPRPYLTCRLVVVDQLGLPVATLDSGNTGAEDALDAPPCTFVCDIDALPLVPGRYRIDLALRTPAAWQDEVTGAVYFEVHQGRLAGRPVLSDSAGSLALAHRWSSPER